MNKNEKDIKLALIEATNSTRKKYSNLLNGRKECNRILEEQFKPITSKLNTLIGMNNGCDSHGDDGNITQIPNSNFISQMTDDNNDDDDEQSDTSESTRVNRNIQQYKNQIYQNSLIQRNRSNIDDIIKQEPQETVSNEEHLPEASTSQNVSDYVQHPNINNVPAKLADLKAKLAVEYAKSKLFSDSSNQIDDLVLAEIDLPPESSENESSDPDYTMSSESSDSDDDDADSMQWDDNEFNINLINKGNKRYRRDDIDYTDVGGFSKKANNSNKNQPNLRANERREKREDQTDNLKTITETIRRKNREKSVRFTKRDATFDGLSNVRKRKLAPEDPPEVNTGETPTKKTKKKTPNRKKNQCTSKYVPGKSIIQPKPRERSGVNLSKRVQSNVRKHKLTPEEPPELNIGEPPAKKPKKKSRHTSEYVPRKRIIRSTSSEFVGKGIGDNIMNCDGNVSNYKWWSDPNMLISRLKLLLASQSAGHDGHQNEIASILQELRDADIIE